ncbi:cis-muuroladiene synthase-like [Andrographis paniculata]|uniref:cis-muuroladiene synthase-like n=1 Tax=Andrographis paniculata TaxID=175694 RepID=UPI0021E8BECB|nr:cis-muuroladiene synthase-like [Andrographis paniculata]
MNDTFDSYATLEEAKKFMEILQQQRWDMEEVDQLPDMMQIAYQTIFSVLEKLEQHISKQGRPYAVSYFRGAVSTYLQKAQLFIHLNQSCCCSSRSKIQK